MCFMAKADRTQSDGAIFNFSTGRYYFVPRLGFSNIWKRYDISSYLIHISFRIFFQTVLFKLRKSRRVMPNPLRYQCLYTAFYTA